MKIVYVSHIKANGTNGFCWSVPASVSAQSAIDDVVWLNTGDRVMDNWRNIPAFHHVSGRLYSLIKLLPDSHKTPDLVVFEGVYDCFYFILWGMELKKKGIPYIIIPRSALTEAAMNNHARLKKKIAHFLFYDRFINHAAALHLLTKGEAAQTTKLFKKPYVVLPNGITFPSLTKTSYSHTGINAVFIGRIDIYQKGLDILVKSIDKERKTLEDHQFQLHVYGPESKDSIRLKSMCDTFGVNHLVSVHPKVTGQEKETVLMNSDVFILTSRFEGLPMGLIEALSYGLPCAVTTGTFMGDDVKEAKAGWVSDVTEEGVGSMLVDICSQRDSFGCLGENARTLAKKYDWDGIAQETHEAYQKVIK